MLPGIVQTWTVWLALVAVLSSSLAPRGTSGDAGLVLCVGCDRVGFTISAPCSSTYDCCQDGGQHDDESGMYITAAEDDTCSCMDVSFPSHTLPFTVLASGVDDLKFIAFAPVVRSEICFDDVAPRLLRHMSAIEPPWELTPSSRATVFQI